MWEQTDGRTDGRYLVRLSDLLLLLDVVCFSLSEEWTVQW